MTPDASARSRRTTSGITTRGTTGASRALTWSITRSSQPKPERSACSTSMENRRAADAGTGMRNLVSEADGEVSARRVAVTSACMRARWRRSRNTACFELGGLLHELSGQRDGLGDAPLVLARSRVSL